MISDEYTRGNVAGGWTRQRSAVMDPKAREENQKTLQSLLNKATLRLDESYAATSPAQQHMVDPEVKLADLIDTLVEYRLEDARDTASFTGLLITLAEGLRQDPNATVAIYQMRPNAIGKRELKNENGEIDTFQQGPTRLAGGGYSYPGDEFFKYAGKISLQIHVFDLTLDKKVVARSPLITIHVPRALAAAWLVQIQRGQQASA